MPMVVYWMGIRFRALPLDGTLCTMLEKLIRSLKSMELEEQIYHIAVLMCGFSVLLPWFGSHDVTYQSWMGIDFYTGYIGRLVLIIQCFLLTMTILPMLGGPTLIQRSYRPLLRLVLSGMSSLLIIAAFTVLVRVTSEIANTEVRFGVYVSIVSGIIAFLYAYLRYQQYAKLRQQEVFRHPEEKKIIVPQVDTDLSVSLPLPPPPPPPPLEDHRPFHPS